ncbi:MAG: hypothetical protein B7Z44_17795, partial [Caulobacter sp. 12-67-6]
GGILLLRLDCVMDRHEARAQFLDRFVEQRVHLHQIALDLGQMLVPVLVAKEEGVLDQAIYDGRVEGALAPAPDSALVPAE